MGEDIQAIARPPPKSTVWRAIVSFMLKEAAVANLKLRITGMTCGHCQAKVEKALKGVSGVYSAIIDLPDGEAEVDFDDDRLTAAQLIAAVQQTGYDAKLAG